MSTRKQLFPVTMPPRPCGVPRGTTRRASGGMREIIPVRRSRNRCEAESYNRSLTAGAHPRDFEGRRVERLRAGAHIETLVTLRAPAAGPPPAGGDEREAWKRGASASLNLRRAFQRRPGSSSLRPGRSVPTGEVARWRGGFAEKNLLGSA